MNEKVAQVISELQDRETCDVILEGIESLTDFVISNQDHASKEAVIAHITVLNNLRRTVRDIGSVSESNV